MWASGQKPTHKDRFQVINERLFHFPKTFILVSKNKNVRHSPANRRHKRDFRNFSYFLVVPLFLYTATNAYAGVFSFVTDLLSKQTKAETVTPDRNSQNAPILSASYLSFQSGTTTDETPTEPGALDLTVGPMRDSTQEEQHIPSSDEISLYVVHPGDTLASVARLYDVTQNTIVWANNLKNKKLTVGDTLVILPISGVRYTVKSGDTLKGLAKKFKGDAEEIASFNDLTADSALAVGQIVIIPDGEIVEDKTTTTGTTNTKPRIVPLPTGGTAQYVGYFMRPINGGVRTQGVHGHNGVDLAAPVGTPIHASADGTVILSREGGWNGGYGNYVVIQHPNGTQTLYAHTYQNLVKQGDVVTQGQTIALLGSTGHSTGPHVHFEIRNGPRNPF